MALEAGSDLPVLSFLQSFGWHVGTWLVANIPNICQMWDLSTAWPCCAAGGSRTYIVMYISRCRRPLLRQVGPEGFPQVLGRSAPGSQAVALLLPFFLLRPFPVPLVKHTHQMVK